jgi:predicted DCC family thiol-disulfide oxidoreductase YuxK
MAAAVLFPLTIFYDASCPMCATEMHVLKSRDTGNCLDLVDCSAPGFDESVLAGLPIRRKDLMTLIHARDAHGRWYVGIDVFEIAYRAAGLEMLAGVWGSRRLRPLLHRIYPWIARNRQILSHLGFNRLVRLVLPAACRDHHGACARRWARPN